MNSVNQIQTVLAKHAAWLRGEEGGIRANLRYADLRHADLSYTDLRYADLRYADLSHANLSEADLRGACFKLGVSVGRLWWTQTVGPQGSRRDCLFVVWSETFGLRWWVGCKQCVSTSELLALVAKAHGDNPHAETYRHVIEFVVNHPDRRRLENDWFATESSADYALDGRAA
jgi:hypothetical protein